jgi:hypothetical protein
VPAQSSPARAEFRDLLNGIVHVSQCLGPSRPASLAAAEGEVSRREDALLARILASPLAADLEQAIREDAELMRNANEADCVAHDWDHPDSPQNIAKYRELLDGKREHLGRVEAALDRLTAGCRPSD